MTCHFPFMMRTFYTYVFFFVFFVSQVCWRVLWLYSQSMVCTRPVMMWLSSTHLILTGRSCRATASGLLSFMPPGKFDKCDGFLDAFALHLMPETFRVNYLCVNSCTIIARVSSKVFNTQYKLLLWHCWLCFDHTFFIHCHRCTPKAVSYSP